MTLPVPLVLLIVPVVSTLAGGLLAVRLRRSLPLLVALGAGLLLGAAFLDLLPEAILLGMNSALSPADVLGLTLLAFLAFFSIASLLDRLVSHPTAGVSRRVAGRIGGAWLILHSLRDGMAIGATYAASPSAGVAVALGIAAHDLGDGMNTVILTTNGEEPRLSDYLFLAGDALAPLVGGLAAAWWLGSLRNSVVLLAVAAGFFLQMAAGEFLPQVRRAQGTGRLLVPAVLLGSSVIYVANLLLGKYR